MLIQESINDFRSIQMYEAMFGGDEALDHFYLDYKYGPDGASITVSDVPVTDEYGYSNESNRLRPGRYITFKGYPTEDGSVGSCFASGSRGIAMSTACKDKEGAWSFMRQCLLPVAEDQFYSQFYVNKADFEKAIEKSMEPNYEYDENGNILLDENGDPLVYKDTIWITGDQTIEMDKPTQADYDQFMELYNAIDRMYRYDENVYNIVNEQCGAYFSGDKSLEETASQIQSRVKLYVNENR